jgi:hypothetical protein
MVKHKCFVSIETLLLYTHIIYISIDSVILIYKLSKPSGNTSI